MGDPEIIDYGKLGFTISQAFVEQLNTYKKSKIVAPNFLLWNGNFVKTIERIKIPKRGKIICQIILDAYLEKKMNGFDLKFEDGYLILEEGEKINHLRTWSEPQHETELEYEFISKENSLLFVWNISKVYLENGKVIEGKWIDNASFRVDNNNNHYKFYCNHSSSKNFNFNDFIFSIEIIEV